MTGSDEPADRERRARSFGEAVGAYERARPSYPDAVVDWLVPAGARDVLDLGAGSGKLTRSLVARGLRVTAVDPDPAMLAALAASLPDVRAELGTAEAIPLPDDSVDLVTVAQAWHWVDAPVAIAEAARVLRPGGRLAIVWNLRDERDPWNRRFGSAAERSGAEMYLDRELELTAPFGPPQTRWHEWSRTLTRAGVLELVHSRSAWITRDADGRAEMDAEVEAVLDSDPDAVARDAWTMAMRTFAARADLPA